MKKSRFVKDLYIQLNKRDREIKVISENAENEIKKKLDDITALNVVLKMNNEIVKEFVNSKKASVVKNKRASYKKRGTISKAFRQSIPSPKWRTEIPKVLMSTSTPLTARQVSEMICPDGSKKSKIVQSRRCSATMSILRKEGLVKEIRNASGSRILFTV